uniref:Uncharacterized protein n=1 Tax=Rhizophora mucronata TaxID=61149 RepID=A0A2P2PV65_RHIMU
MAILLTGIIQPFSRFFQQQLKLVKGDSSNKLI